MDLSKFTHSIVHHEARIPFTNLAVLLGLPDGVEIDTDPAGVGVIFRWIEPAPSPEKPEPTKKKTPKAAAEPVPTPPAVEVDWTAALNDARPAALESK